MPEDYRLFVSEDRKIMVRVWWPNSPEDEAWEVATRDDESGIWGIPVILKEEK